MKSSTRMTKGKIVVEAGKQLTPDAFPLGNWIPGRRRVPSQERSLRTRKQILAAAETLAKSEGVGNITMQMIASKAKIAAGTAYQFFDDRDAIFAEIYEEWVKVWWPALMKHTTTPWTEGNWRERLHALVIGMGKIHLETSSRWDIITYINSTKQGRVALRTLLEANIDRYVDWAGPLFRTRGYNAAEKVLRSSSRLAAKKVVSLAQVIAMAGATIGTVGQITASKLCRARLERSIQAWRWSIMVR